MGMWSSLVWIIWIGDNRDNGLRDTGQYGERIGIND